MITIPIYLILLIHPGGRPKMNCLVSVLNFVSWSHLCDQDYYSLYFQVCGNGVTPSGDNTRTVARHLTFSGVLASRGMPFFDFIRHSNTSLCLLCGKGTRAYVFDIFHHCQCLFVPNPGVTYQSLRYFYPYHYLKA